MGEKSLFNGNAGEEICKKFLERIGWTNPRQNASIPCRNPKHLNKEGHEKRTHGDDFLFIRRDVFNSERILVINVQSKLTSDDYPTGSHLLADFAKKYKELIESTECTLLDPEIQNEIMGIYQRARHSSVSILIWISQNERAKDRQLVKELSEARGIDDTWPVLLVDVSRISFISRMLDFMSLRKPELCNSWHYYISEIDQTMEGTSHNNTIMPYSYLAGGMIPLIVVKDEKKGLFLFCEEPYGTESMLYCLNAADRIMKGWGQFLAIIFPDYNDKDYQHKQIKAQALSSVQESIDAEIDVYSLQPSALNS